MNAEKNRRVGDRDVELEDEKLHEAAQAYALKATTETGSGASRLYGVRAEAFEAGYKAAMGWEEITTPPVAPPRDDDEPQRDEKPRGWAAPPESRRDR